MKTINFTDLELESMIEMFTAEMEDAQVYIDQIQELLKKFGAKPTKEKGTEKEPIQKRGQKPAGKIFEKSEPKKRGRKPREVLTTPEIILPDNPVKKEKKVTKVKAKGEQPVIKSAPVKKAENKVIPAQASTEKSVPVAATNANTKKKVEPIPVSVGEAKKEVIRLNLK